MAEVQYKWPENHKSRLIGKRVERLDGMVKSTGTAKYTYDVNLPKQLIVHALGCPARALSRVVGRYLGRGKGSRRGARSSPQCSQSGRRTGRDSGRWHADRVRGSGKRSRSRRRGLQAGRQVRVARGVHRGP